MLQKLHLLTTPDAPTLPCAAECQTERKLLNTAFIAKLALVEEETDETMFWLELLLELERTTPQRVNTILDELSQIVAMTVASIRTARENRERIWPAP